MQTTLTSLLLLLLTQIALAQPSATPGKYGSQIIQRVGKADVEAATGLAMKAPTFMDTDFKRNTIAYYHSVTPQPYNAEVCVISLGVLDKVMYDAEVKMNKGMVKQSGELTGLGDQAYWYEMGQGAGAYSKIGVRRGDKYLSVSLTQTKPGLARMDAVKQLVARLMPLL